MIITLDHSSAEPEAHYCGISPRYILHESAYSILCRFSLYNVVAGRELVGIFANHEYSSRRPKSQRSPHLACTQSVDLAVMADTFSLPMFKIHDLFLCPTSVPFDRHVSEVLKVCPECLAQGRHFTIFQYGLVHQCPIHQIELQQRCPNCSATVRYALSAQLFKTPYGCWHCGLQLGTARNKDVFRYINAIGMERLRRSYRAFELARGKYLNFAVGGTEELYCDNVLQLSTSFREIAETENVLFSHIQGLAAELSPKLICAQYAWFRWHPNHGTRACGKIVPVGAQDLRSTAKAIFRHFRKKRLGGFKLSIRALLPLWRSLESRQIPAEGYPVIAWLDWYCFWSGVGAPCQLVDKKGLIQISKWLLKVSRHSVFLECRDARTKNWLMQRLFAHEVFALLARQLACVAQANTGVLEGTPAKIVYERKLLPVCWATYFQHHLDHMRILFIPGCAGVFSPNGDHQGRTNLRHILKQCVDQDLSQ